MKNNFKEGDNVFVYPYGWCILIKIYNDDYRQIRHNEQQIEVHKDLISFTVYKLEGFTQEIPFDPKIGEKYFFWNDETIMNDAVGYGRLKQISNNINFPYFFGTKYFQFCSETNPLL